MKPRLLVRVLIWLTVSSAAWTPSVAAADLPRHGVLGAALSENAGVVTVTAVVPGSAAALAQIEPGDIIRSIGAAAVTTSSDVIQTVRHTPAGTTISLAIVRNGQRKIVAAAVGAPPNEDDPLVDTRYESLVVQNSLRRVLIDVPKHRAGRRPAVLLIGGIGCFSVDVAANPEDGYLRIARDLARAGFVTMRLEKSGVGDSRGPPCHDVDFHDESAGYAVALDALRRDGRVDPARMYLLGHSIGTLIAPRLALDRKVAGIIVSEAVGRDWFEYELQNLRRQLELGGDPPDTVDTKLQSKEYCMHRLLIAHELESQIEAADPSCKERNGIYPVAAPYMQQVAALNVIEPWTRVNVPVLVVYGSSDYVVAPEDQRRIADVVNHVHPGLATLVPVEHMDHNLQIAATPADFYAANNLGTKTRYQIEFSDAVLRWICAYEQCTSE
jgi:pimeloyl-ACP methyl ester carboxylesterase